MYLEEIKEKRMLKLVNYSARGVVNRVSHYVRNYAEADDIVSCKDLNQI